MATDSSSATPRTVTLAQPGENVCIPFAIRTSGPEVGEGRPMPPRHATTLRNHDEVCRERCSETGAVSVDTNNALAMGALESVITRSCVTASGSSLTDGQSNRTIEVGIKPSRRPCPDVVESLSRAASPAIVSADPSVVEYHRQSQRSKSFNGLLMSTSTCKPFPVPAPRRKKLVNQSVGEVPSLDRMKSVDQFSTRPTSKLDDADSTSGRAVAVAQVVEATVSDVEIVLSHAVVVSSAGCIKCRTDEVRNTSTTTPLAIITPSTGNQSTVVVEERCRVADNRADIRSSGMTRVGYENAVKKHQSSADCLNDDSVDGDFSQRGDRRAGPRIHSQSPQRRGVDSDCKPLGMM